MRGRRSQSAESFESVFGSVCTRYQQKCFKADASLEQEAAERHKTEVKAGKQLERVQLHMPEWAWSILMENQSVYFGWFNIDMAKVRRPREHAI